MSDSRPAGVHRTRATAPRDSSNVAAEATSGEMLATQLEWVVAGCGVWAVLGLSAALVMRRRGHEFPPAAILGILFGPLFIPLARRDLRAHNPGERSIIVELPPERNGSVDVLISADLANTKMGIVGAIEREVGNGYGRLMIGAAIDYESAQTNVFSLRARQTAHRLEVSAMTIESSHPTGRVLVAGPHVDALVDFATRNRYDLVILGPGTRTSGSRRGVHRIRDVAATACAPGRHIRR